MSNQKPQKGLIYTLAQSKTQNSVNYTDSIAITGNGTDIINNPSLTNRAKRKTITRAMMLALIDVAKEKEEHGRVQAYWNTYHCQNTMYSVGDKLHGKYCKNRFCTVCLAIRKADTINRYYPELRKWEEAHFVTLTIKAVKEKSLKKHTDGMMRAFNLIKQRCNKRYQRGKGIKLIGVKSLECNFNPITKTYNPHFHIIVASKEIADLIKKEWLLQWKHNKKLFTSPKAQHIRKVESMEHDLIETIKYGSKLFTEPDVKKKKTDNTPPKIYAYALDNIFVAMKGIRIFERFGFNLPPKEKTTSNTKFVDNYIEWEFLANSTDWVNTETGECLTGFIQPPELSYLLNECLDTSSH